MSGSIDHRRGFVAVVLAALLAACGAPPAEAPPLAARPAPTPVAAVERLLGDLRRDDLAAYAVHALPPDLYAGSEAAWREGRSRWPLSELPLSAQIPAAVDHLAAPGAEAALRRIYRRQFAGQQRELRSTAATLGLFATRYIEREAGYPPDERDHRLQLARALARWGQQAPLADPARIEPLIPRLASAARDSRLAGGEAAFSAAGMHRSLSRLRPLLRQLRQGLRPLGLDLDQALAGAQVELVSQAGDRARVRLRYRLAGQDIDTMLELVRQDGGWFLADSLRHARALLDAAPGGLPAAEPPPPPTSA